MAYVIRLPGDFFPETGGKKQYFIHVEMFYTQQKMVFESHMSFTFHLHKQLIFINIANFHNQIANI